MIGYLKPRKIRESETSVRENDLAAHLTSRQADGSYRSDSRNGDIMGAHLLETSSQFAGRSSRA